MLDFRYLSAFLAVAESGSFTAAGKKLHVATSAVSRQIQLFEESCGAQLFFRTPREASLTPVGKRLVEEALRFREASDRALDGNRGGRLRLGTLQGVLRHWLVDLIAEEPFFDDLDLEIRVGTPGELISAVAEGTLDATFFSFVHLTHVPATMEVHRLFRERIVLISLTKVDLEDLRSHPWICLTPSTWIVKFARKPPVRQILVNDMDAIVDLVRRGRGIAMVPRYVVGDPRGLHVQEVKRFAGEHICLVHRHYERPPEPISQLVELVRRRSR